MRQRADFQFFVAECCFFCLHLFWNCARNQSTFKHPFDTWDGSEDLGVGSHRQTEAPLSPNDVKWWKSVQSAVASRFNCSLSMRLHVKLFSCSRDLMRELPACCSQLTSSRVTVMIIRNHLCVDWFGVKSNQQINICARWLRQWSLKRGETVVKEAKHQLHFLPQHIQYVHICWRAPVHHLCFLWFSYKHKQICIRWQLCFSPHWALSLRLVLALRC